MTDEELNFILMTGATDPLATFETIMARRRGIISPVTPIFDSIIPEELGGFPDNIQITRNPRFFMIDVLCNGIYVGSIAEEDFSRESLITFIYENRSKWNDL